MYALSQNNPRLPGFNFYSPGRRYAELSRAIRLWGRYEICQDCLLDGRHLGVVVVTPLFFMFHLIGRQDPPPVTHPGFYYGFATIVLAWQIAFLVIGSDPLRLRQLMIPSMIEKFGYGTAVLVLFLASQMRPGDLLLGSVDLVLGILFVVAFYRTRARAQEPREK